MLVANPVEAMMTVGQFQPVASSPERGRRLENRASGVPESRRRRQTPKSNPCDTASPVDFPSATTAGPNAARCDSASKARRDREDDQEKSPAPCQEPFPSCTDKRFLSSFSCPPIGGFRVSSSRLRSHLVDSKSVGLHDTSRLANSFSPPTSVRRRLRPSKRYVSRLWSRPSSVRIVACRSWA